jgi:hypothetical protein
MKNYVARTMGSVFSAYSVIALSVCMAFFKAHAAPLKPRIVILTDISLSEPDDQQSLVRLLAHADLYEIEGIVLTTGWSERHPNEDMGKAKGVIDAYEKDLPNLMRRSNQTRFSHDDERQEIGYWPSAQYLRDRTMFGSMVMGMEFVGAGNHSNGSEFIIKLADEDDDRPIWVTFWGGGNTLAQSIWQVQQTRSESELKTFLHKVRAYAIADQDTKNRTSFDLSSHAWMRRTFSDDLLFIWESSAWHHQVSAAKRGKWPEYVTHIQQHGNLGDQYPKYRYGVEGDTPSFLHLMPNGLNNPDVPTQAGWGGYSEWGLGEDRNGYSFRNQKGQGDAHSICKFYAEYFEPAVFNNFAARMDWAKEGKGNRNPVVLIEDDDSLDILTLNPDQGAVVKLDASRTADPDGDTLSYKWWFQPEAGSYSGTVEIGNSSSDEAWIKIPEDSAGTAFHVICEVTDGGVPNLASYRRIIFAPVR